ncbi:arsenite methyltransferase [Candidatus Bathyarchaeota archaeon]|nr:arsenite methyltransferase [Candidatus Bathyarchaeota archaeon]
MKEEKVKKIVRESYGKIAKNGCSCCDSGSGKELDYTEEELKSVPEGANLSLGCGNPVALASIKKGETVLDLGSGGGLDCFLAAKKVGEKGKVIGVDMTPEMIDRARRNARKGGYRNVEFRLGEIENLPVADKTVDLLISNCVINLAPNKKRVFEEAFRVLKPGGRLMISDIVLLKKLPETIKKSKRAYVGCVSGATMKNEYLALLKDAGFQEVSIIEEAHFPAETIIAEAAAEGVGSSKTFIAEEIANSVASVKVCGVKPK